MKYKVGDEVKVVKNESGHTFSIGTIVSICDIDEDEEGKYYRITNNIKKWWVEENDIKAVDNKFKEGQKVLIGKNKILGVITRIDDNDFDENGLTLKNYRVDIKDNCFWCSVYDLEEIVS